MLEKVCGSFIMTLLQMLLQIFGIDNTSSSHTDNQQNNFFVLAEGPADGIYDSNGAVEKS